MFITACSVPTDVPRAGITDTEDDSMKENTVDSDDQEVMVDDTTEDDTDKMEGSMEEVTGNMVESIVSVDKEKSSFEFEGFKPGRSHVGTFEIADATFYYDSEGNIEKIEGTIDATSVKTDNEDLDAHLQKDDFFDVENFPTIEMVSKTIDVENSMITGDLTLHGVTKEVSFPANITKTSVKTNFILDTKPFEMTNAVVSNEVRIAFQLFTE